jgi:hypothetical protein
MNGIFPRRGNEQRWFDKHKRHRCVVCGKRDVNWRIDIQTDWFRGNDDVVYAHKACVKGKSGADLLHLKYAKTEAIAE